MSAPKHTFLLLDGNALLHRAWHAIPPLTTKDGLVVNAVYGFAMVVEKMIERYQPDYMAVAWDLPGETFRHKLYPEYKAQREKKEQELYDQIPIIQKILSAFGVPSVSEEGFEADDVIGTLAREARQKKMATMIVTGDLDSLQLVDDDTSVLFFQKGISETKHYDEAAVQERYGLAPAQLIDYKALRGDPSDNLPGIAGIGEKTATDLLQRYGSIEGIYQALPQIEEKVAKKLRGQEDRVEASKVLVSIVREVKTGFRFDEAKRKEPDLKRLLPLYRDLEFRTLLKKYAEAKVVSPRPQPGLVRNNIQIVRDADKVQRTFSPGSTLGVLIAEQAPDLFGATVAAAALSDGKQTIVVMNPTKEALTRLQSILGKASLVVTHDLKHLMHQLCVPITTPAFDIMIASYLLHSGTRVHDLTSAAYQTLGQTLPEVPTTFAKEREYQTLGSIAAALPALAVKMRSMMEAVSLTKVFDDIEMPLVPVLYKMEREGIELNGESLAVFSLSLKKRIDALTEPIHQAAGTDFNINSPSQLAEVLFEKMHLPTKGIKKTKSGFSTAAPELEKLWDAHAIIPLLSEYRELTKLQSTYVEALPKLVAQDGRVHTSYNQTVAATGRLSSSDPNLQNIPVKTELGREIRRAFVAPRGRVLVAADYSQIELRLAAVIAQDKPFIAAFREGADIHTRTAAEVWGVEEEQVTKEQRRAAKAINFGIIYGMGPRSLSRSTGLTMDQAKEFIDRYFQIHHAVRDYLDHTKVLAHTQGYVETLFGRRRSFPEIQSGVPMLVAQAERMAINMPVQGTEADIMKMAMLRVDGWLAKSQWPASMLLQVHDELVLEVDKDAVAAVARGVREMMEGVGAFEVPLVVDIEVGKNWGEMEPL